MIWPQHNWIMAVSLLKLALKVFVKNPVFSLICLFSLEQAFFFVCKYLKIPFFYQILLTLVEMLTFFIFMCSLVFGLSFTILVFFRFPWVIMFRFIRMVLVEYHPIYWLRWASVSQIFSCCCTILTVNWVSVVAYPIIGLPSPCLVQCR